MAHRGRCPATLSSTIRRVTDVADPAMSAVIELGKRNAKFLGFMPRGGYEDRARKGTLLVAEDDERLIGYVLFDLPRSVVHMAHLCVATAHRKHGVGRQLIAEVSRRHADRRGIELLVRNDYPAFDMWFRLGFEPVRELPGRGA